MSRQLPKMDPTIVRIDPVDGKFHIGARVLYTWNPIFKGKIRLMWNSEWAYVKWDFHPDPGWMPIDRLDVVS